MHIFLVASRRFLQTVFIYVSALFYFDSFPFINLVLPRITPFAFEEGPAQVGQYLTLHCSVPLGDLPMQIEWTLNGQSIGERLGISTLAVGSRSSVLTIDSVEAPHAGNFTCQAKNLAGQQRFTTLLNVYG